MTTDTTEIINDDRGALVEYIEQFLDADERAALFAELDGARAHFTHDRLRIYGRVVDSPRLVCAFGDDGLRYRYSGVDRPTRPWLPGLRAVRERVATAVGQDFSYTLVNLYRDGDDYIGWHSDKYADIVPDSCIASLSLGAERPFRLRGREKDSPVHEIALADGSLLLMKGTTQRLYKHQLPARRAVRRPRFNVTLRLMRATKQGRAW